MNDDTIVRDLAERHFRALQNGSVQNFADNPAKTETKATATRTERLQALRLERNGAVRPEARKVIRSQTGKHISRR